MTCLVNTLAEMSEVIQSTPLNSPSPAVVASDGTLHKLNPKYIIIGTLSSSSGCVSGVPWVWSRPTTDGGIRDVLCESGLKHSKNYPWPLGASPSSSEVYCHKF